MQVSEHCKRWQSDASCWSCCDNMLSVRMRLKSGLWSVAETTLRFCSWLMHRLHCKWYALYRYMSVAWCERSACCSNVWYTLDMSLVASLCICHSQVTDKFVRTVAGPFQLFSMSSVFCFLLLVVFINFFLKLIFHILTRETSAAAAL